jgi:hypothetical protein
VITFDHVSNPNKFPAKAWILRGIITMNVTTLKNIFSKFINSQKIKNPIRTLVCQFNFPKIFPSFQFFLLFLNAKNIILQINIKSTKLIILNKNILKYSGY